MSRCKTKKGERLDQVIKAFHSATCQLYGSYCIGVFYVGNRDFPAVSLLSIPGLLFLLGLSFVIH